MPKLFWAAEVIRVRRATAGVTMRTEPVRSTRLRVARAPDWAIDLASMIRKVYVPCCGYCR